MQTNTLSVCHIGLFDNSKDFWIGDLQDIKSRYPVLESAHIHTFYSILLVEKATGEVTIDHKKVDVTCSQAIILKPDCIHKIQLDPISKGQIICFTKEFFSLRYNTNVLGQFSFLNQNTPIQIKLLKQDFDVLLPVCNQIKQELTNKQKSYVKMLRSYLNIVLIHLDRNATPCKAPILVSPTKEKVQQYQKLIEIHFKTLKKPSDYADLLHISTNYLNKICKTIVGQTSGSLIQNHVVLQAQRLLSYTSYSINEIADQLGYEHTSYFVTLFKKATKQTPEAYRKDQLHR
ncbi:AraC family transcriptional regulator [Myroides sp. LJL119]